MRKWEQLPPEMQTEEVRKYYDILQRKRSSLFFKRVFDIVVSSVMLVALSPTYLILAVTIKCDSKGPVFYRQERVTQYNKRFRIFKFRSMVQGADTGSKLTIYDDSRVTKVGSFIRKYRLDEIGQLIDVLRGTMTFVGTRPEVPKYTACYTPEMMATFLLPAGVTSLTSIFYADESRLLNSVNDDDIDRVYVEQILPEKMHYNLKGLENYSFWGDVKLMFMTFLAMCGKSFKNNIEVKQIDEKAIL